MYRIALKVSMVALVSLYTGAMFSGTTLALELGEQEVTPALKNGVNTVQTGLFGTLAPIGPAVQVILPKSTLIKGTVVAMDDAHTVVPDGNVLVTGDRIATVWSGSQVPAGVKISDARLVDLGPGTLIYPGLINLHDHPTFDILPIVPPPSTNPQPEGGRPTGQEPYANRYQWHQDRDLDRLTTNAVDAAVWGLGLDVEALKRAEARAALGGQTAYQGAGDDNPALDGLLVRNVGATNFGRDRVDEQVPSVDRDFDADGVKKRMLSGDLEAWLVHLAEGVRDGDRPAGDTFSSRHELDRIAELGLLTDATVVLHGTALDRTDFAAMRTAPHAGSGPPLGAKLVWSPLSNLLLYGKTTSVYEALAEGLTVSLGTDWTPTGSNTLLEELKVADIALRDPRVLGSQRGLVPSLAGETALDRQLVDMVTRNPARTLRWSEAGSVETGKAADLLVIRPPASSPTGGMPASVYRSLIDATERDVALVMVGGDPVAGDVEPIKSLRGLDYEVVTSPAGGFRKAIDLTHALMPKGLQTLAIVEQRLSTGLAALGGDGAAAASGPRPPGTKFSYLKSHIDGGRYLLTGDAAFNAALGESFGTTGSSINLERVELKPLFAADDSLFFSVLGNLPPGPNPPYRLMPVNANHVTSAGNPFAQDLFEERWFVP